MKESKRKSKKVGYFQSEESNVYLLIIILYKCTRHYRKVQGYLILYLMFCMGRDSSVGIATRYGLDGPGIESLCGQDFPYQPRPALGPTQPPLQWVPGLSRE